MLTLFPKRPARQTKIPMVEKVGSFNNLRPSDYLALNSDVRAAKLDAYYHYKTYGHAEGRSQLADSSSVVAMRRVKLARLGFKHAPVVPPGPDGVNDYLSASVREAFDIPDAPPVAENDYSAEIIDEINDNPDDLFLDVGAGFRHTYYHNVVNTEVWRSASTDVICVGEELPFVNNSFDRVLCLAVLEHTKRPWLASQEIVRVLKPGGLVRIDWPFLQPVHGYPHHFFNATSMGVTSLFEDSCDIVSAEVRPWQHPIFAVTWMLNEWRRGLSEEERALFGRLTVDDLLSRPAEVLLSEPWCQALPPEVQNIISAGTTLIARKR